MYNERLVEDWKRQELAKYPPNQELRRKQIENISRKLEQIKRETANLKRDPKSPEEQLIVELLKLIKDLAAA